MRFGNVEFEKRGRIALVTLDDPSKHNARTTEMREGVRQSLAEIEADDEIRVGVITGSGDKAFCAGADISRFSFEAQAARKFIRDSLSLSHAPEKCSKPLIAAVNGLALGGGMELAIACDFIIASEHAKFGFPEIRLGLMPGFAIVRLHLIVGRAKAKEMTMLGETIDAEEACRLGLVLRVVPKDRLMEEALAFAAKIASKPPVAIAMIKAAYNRELGGDEMRHAIEAMPFLFLTDDAREGIMAFREKRAPDFK